MPRYARMKAGSGIYHVMVRGINRQAIFEDDEDRDKFIDILEKLMLEGSAALLGYCLMSNHVHLLLREGKDPLDRTLKRIGVPYAFYFNRKYGRSGHLFQDRYRSVAVEDDAYLLMVLRYIHRNPVKAGICSEAGEYDWSSCRYYLDCAWAREPSAGDFIDTSLIAGMMGRAEFEAYTAADNDDTCMDIDGADRRLTDPEARELIRKVTGLSSPQGMQFLADEKRDRFLAELNERGIALRQLERLTGVSYGVIRKACG